MRPNQAHPINFEVSMNFRTLKCWGRRTLALAALLVSTQVAAAADPNAKQADVQLKTDLTHMNIQVSQGAPLPPGGCIAGYAWHTTYGGCRRAESQPEAGACPAGYTGSRTRYRTAYILQANPYDVAYEAWGPWQESCTAPRAGGVVDTVIAKVRGNETGEYWPNSLTGNIAAQMQVNYGTMFGVTIFRPSAELNCIHASGTTSGDTSRSWTGQLLGPGASVNKAASGYCQLSNGNRTATIFGSCDSTSGGDSDFCQSATRVVNITFVNGCTVNTETRDGNNVIDVGSYDICH